VLGGLQRFDGMKPPAAGDFNAIRRFAHAATPSRSISVRRGITR
jgi:hypothetical protein